MDRRWLGFGVLSLGTLMIVLDTTIVNVALPSVKADLGFTDAGLAWVVNAYMLTFGGFLLLGGRLGDLYGPRRLFLAGITLFTLASLACGLATTQVALVVARAAQGVGGAVVSAVSLAIMMGLFTEVAERVKAMAFFGFVAAGGGSIGVLAGGFLTNALDWHWVFLVNIPIGVAVFAAALAWLPATQGAGAGRRLDVLGAVLVTSAILAAVYAVVNAPTAGWRAPATLGLLATSVALLAAFLAVESRVRDPLVPLDLFRRRNLATANVIGVLWAAAMFGWFFMSALYMQFVLGYSPLQVGLAFLPSNLIMAAFSFGLSARVVMRYGTRGPLAVGLALAAVGLALFARAPVGGSYVVDVLPGMLLLGVGAGMAFNPVFLVAMGDAKPDEAGLASGVLNTSFMMGGALGLAVLAGVAAASTSASSAAGVATADALTSGYHAAFLAAAACAALAAALGALILRPAAASPNAHDPHPVEV